MAYVIKHVAESTTLSTILGCGVGGVHSLFGTAVQTGVVMVIYLEEAVARKKAAEGMLTVAGLREAVIEGALLRLRPKVMTVSTIVAGLLPIMWSARTGAEVMKPLATPVLGGMVSSLSHVLIVTPVIFTWLRERELRRRNGRLRCRRAANAVSYTGGLMDAEQSIAEIERLERLFAVPDTRPLSLNDPGAQSGHNNCRMRSPEPDTEAPA
jgi:hypothetical protein